MKSRKLFAILTLVAFMMTLVPFAAFASDRYTSIIKVDTTTVEADGEKDAEFTVYVRNSDNTVVPNAVVYVASERESTDTITAEEGYAQEDGGNYQAITTDSSGKAEFTVTSRASGEAKIAVGLNNQVYEYLTDSDVTATDAEIIGTKTITFEASDASDVQLVAVENRAGDKYGDDDNEVALNDESILDGEEGDRVYFTSDNGLVLDEGSVAANGIDYYALTFAVSNTSNAPIEDETVEISANKSDVSFNTTEKDTDEIGEAEFKVYAKKAGTYKITADVGSETAVVWVTFGASEVADVKLASDVDPLVATDEDGAASFKLEFFDANGYTVNPEDIIFGDGGDTELDFEWITEPDDSDLEDDWAYDSKEDGDFSDDYVEFTEDNLLKVKLPELEEEGQYVLRTNIENGKYIDIEFEAKEQGDITELTIKYDNANLELGAVSDAPTVKRYDADGVALEVKNESDLEFSINDYRAIEKDSVGDVSDPRDAFTENGVIYVTDDDDYLGEYVITVVDTKEDLTASTEITVGNAAIGLDVEVPDTLPVGEETAVELSVLDDADRIVGLGDGVDIEYDAYIISQPDGANASAEASISDSKFSKDLKEKGYADVDVYSQKAGEVKVSFVLKVTKADASNVTLTKTVTFDFAEAKPEVEAGAKNVTMFIGSTGYVVDGVAATMDQAPFIQDSRTFVPVRMVATALGADNEDTMWDAATQTITLEREDMTVTMTVGSNVLTKSDGTTVVADVAPFIVAETGRTVIPFRAIAEAFGADVEAVFAADGTVTAVTFAQN
ncbi:MAG: stalk domain-containing protein [Peptococcaceae bacterium]